MSAFFLHIHLTGTITELSSPPDTVGGDGSSLFLIPCLYDCLTCIPLGGDVERRNGLCTLLYTILYIGCTMS